MTRGTFVVVLLVLSALAAASCGGGADSTAEGPKGATAAKTTPQAKDVVNEEMRITINTDLRLEIPDDAKPGLTTLILLNRSDAPQRLSVAREDAPEQPVVIGSVTPRNEVTMPVRLESGRYLVQLLGGTKAQAEGVLIIP